MAPTRALASNSLAVLAHPHYPRASGAANSLNPRSSISTATKAALTNAASIAGLMLTTEVMITKIDDDEAGNKVSGAVR